MASLASVLQAVIDVLPSSIPDSLKSQYRDSIQRHAVALDSIEQCADGTEPTESAGMASKGCKILFGNHAVTPKASIYKKQQQENWSTTCWLPAACIVKAHNSVEVALALKIVTFVRSKFAVRSCGHSANPGFASIGESGVLLDLGALNEISLSKEKDIVSLGPGAKWDEVYEELEEHELTVVGGRVAGVGVGGLITGGGMSHFSNRWGLVCDNVKNMEVVLADSRIVQANTNENPDLFRALKGGGANFGIVTRFDLYTNPDYRVWYSFKVFNVADKDRVIKAAIEVQKAMDQDDRIGFFLSVGAGFFVAGMLYMEGTEFPAVFHVFDGIEPMMTTVPETVGTQLSVTQATSMAGEAKREIGTAAVLPDAELYAELHSVLASIITSTSFSLSFTFQPIGAAAVEKGAKSGGNSLNVPLKNQAWLGIIAQWTDDADDDLARSQIRELISSIHSTAQKRGLLLDFHFMNDASYTQSPLQGYGPESLKFLRRTSLKYDPEFVFQRLQNSGFLLSKVAMQ